MEILRAMVGGTGGEGGDWRRRGAGGGGGDAQRGRGAPEDRPVGPGAGLTIVGVDAELNLALDGGLDLLLPHALDAQVVKAGGGGDGREVVTTPQV